MSTSYQITPYDPFGKVTDTLDDLRIDPAEYERRLLERWPLAEQIQSFADAPVCYRLNWRSKDGIHWLGDEIYLMSDLQTIIIGRAPSVEFAQWHRAFIPPRYRLFVSCDADDDIQEIPPGVTLADAAKILGVDEFGDPRMIFHITTQQEHMAHIALSLQKSDAWRTYHSAQFDSLGYLQCMGAQQIRRLADAQHHGQHGLVLMWLHVEHITAPIEYVELPGISTPGETFPRILGPLDGIAIGRVVPYEPDPDGTFPWPVDIIEMP